MKALEAKFDKKIDGQTVEIKAAMSEQHTELTKSIKDAVSAPTLGGFRIKLMWVIFSGICGIFAIAFANEWVHQLVNHGKP